MPSGHRPLELLVQLGQGGFSQSVTLNYNIHLKRGPIFMETTRDTDFKQRFFRYYSRFDKITFRSITNICVSSVRYSVLFDTPFFSIAIFGYIVY